MSPVGGEEKDETSTKPRMHCQRILQFEDPGHARRLGMVSGTGENRVDKGFRESIPRQVDKKTGVPKEETAAAKSLQSCPTLCNPREGSPPGSLVPGILQARTLEWVAISSSKA